MTQAAQMQQPTESVQSMFPNDAGGVNNTASETHVDSYRSLDPARASLEDYNRSMLQYTQRQMSTFVDVDDSHSGSGTSSRSSQSSGQSGRSNEGTGSGLARSANGPLPPSTTPLTWLGPRSAGVTWLMTSALRTKPCSHGFIQAMAHDNVI
ncbi:uncharacterized protein N7506_003777 [Penicillium brevicompactum]|uniref:uncharacterized protein n=1 Tax=Penicillium brevicompactum TaxID=5074 RepID=UPI00253FFFFB|nr:uncharacterized protein N7506_003777 [Penicillium brevicompactum]KAJ5343953.1 hypothetical protein N7506_003777 [Penicillium brevicompactum]